MLSARSTKVPICAKVEDLVAQHGAVEGAADQRRLALDLVEHLRQVALVDRLASMRFSAIQASLMLSQVSRVSAVRTMRALKRAVSIEDMTLDGLVVSRSRKSDTARRVFAVFGARKPEIGAGRQQHRVPFLLGARESGQRHAQPGIDQARHVLRPLDVAVHPVEAVGDVRPRSMQRPFVPLSRRAPRCPWCRRLARN